MKRLISRKRELQALIAISVASAASQAHAALPPGLDAFFTALETDFGTLEGYAWGVLLVVTGGFIWMKLAKRAANKAT